MKIFIAAITIIAFFLINQRNGLESNAKPNAKESVKYNRIINTYKHPYYERYINYLDTPHISYTDSLNSYNSEGC